MLVWYNHLPSPLPEVSGWVACHTTWGEGVLILAGNYIIRDSSAFTYTKSIFLNMWAVLVSIFYIFCSDGLPGIWSIKFWARFFIMPRAPITTRIVFVLSFHIFATSISRSLYLESFWNSLREMFLSDGTVTSIMIHVFSSKGSVCFYLYFDHYH